MYSQSAQLGSLAAPADIGYDVVPGNVLKMILVPLAGNDGTATNITTSAYWLAKIALAASSPQKACITPFIDAFKLEATKTITEGGNDNSTANGAPRVKAVTFAQGSGKCSAVPQALIDEFNKLTAKSGNFQQGTRLGAYLVYDGAAIRGMKDGKPIPIYNVIFTDPAQGGLGASDDYDLEFNFLGGWSTNTKVFEADFVLSSLTNPAA